MSENSPLSPSVAGSLAGQLTPAVIAHLGGRQRDALAAERDAAVARAEVAEAALARVGEVADGWETPGAPYYNAIAAHLLRRALSGDTPTEPTGDEPRPDCFCGDPARDGVHRAHECVPWTTRPTVPRRGLFPDPTAALRPVREALAAAPTQDGDDR